MKKHQLARLHPMIIACCTKYVLESMGETSPSMDIVHAGRSRARRVREAPRDNVMLCVLCIYQSDYVAEHCKIQALRNFGKRLT